MLKNVARGAYLLLMVVMIASYAASVARSSVPEPEPEKPISRMYS